MFRPQLTIQICYSSTLVTAVLAVSLLPQASSAAQPLNFNKDVRPILAKNCFPCHGPDANAREADLRLDRPEDAMADRDGIFAIKPGSLDESDAARRISSDDPDERMPPADAKLVLGKREIQIIKQWIAEGAKYEQHWAYVAPRKAALPSVKNGDWPLNAVDRHVLAHLEQKQLPPNPPADRYTLARRVYLDLIGLLPTPEEADEFVNDGRPGAYERLVDRLLASPRYGERWARPWLDLARFADTNGYEKDREREVWAYRDYVIDSLNADKPYAQFTIEQIAGDMLDDPTAEQLIATGFHRNTMINEEGGVDMEEFRFESVVDRVSTSATVWLGLTLGCARCHSHKFDPISQREFYQLFAFLNNADEPEMKLADESIHARRQKIEQRIAALEADLANRFPVPDGVDRQQHVQNKFQEWQAQVKAKSSHWRVLWPTEFQSAKLATLTLLPDGSILAGGNIPNNDVYTLNATADLKSMTAIRLEALPHESLPDRGPGRSLFDSGGGAKGDFLLTDFQLESAEQPTADFQRAAFDKAFETVALNDKKTAAAAIDDSEDSGWSLGKPAIGKAQHAVFVLREPLGRGAPLALRFTIVNQFIHQMTLGRFRLSVTTDGNPRSSGVPAEIESIVLLDESQRTDAQRQMLWDYYLRRGATDLKAVHDEIDQLRAALPAYPTTMVMSERTAEHARMTHVHHRGEYLSPRDAVQPQVPDILHDLRADAPRNRLAFAEWLVDADNPLVDRVAVNRVWQSFFGVGLVRTSEDFGVQGEAPSHPELLDWLAVEFREQGRSFKQIHRLIVTSATYQQSAVTAGDVWQADPENRSLARGPRFRLPAEIVRDATLSASGQLSHKIGGPSVFPPQPASVTALAYGNTQWKTSSGEDRYRRGLYTHTKRTTPYAAFMNFDGTSGEVCIARRNRSNTALQALNLLNDEAFNEAARALALSAIRDQSGGNADQSGENVDLIIARMFRRALTRPARADELQALLSFYSQQRKRLVGGELNAKIMLGPDHGAGGVNLDDWAAYAAVARVILNLDEMIVKP